MGPLRAAVVGYGLAGATFHAPLISSVPGFAVTTVVTSDPGRRSQALRDLPDVQVLSGVDELWPRADEHDFVVVAAANDAHVPIARAAVDAGLPAVVDKPLAPTAAEARTLVAHAEARGVLLTVFHNRRWDSDLLTLRRLIGAGVIGEVRRFESRFERWRPEPRAGAWRETASPAAGGGVLLDLGTHLVDQALLLLGPANQVHGEVDHRRGLAGDDDAFVALRHASGAYSHLWMSAVAAAPGPRLRVLGSQAAYVVEEVDGQEDALRAGRRPGAGGPWGTELESRWGRLVRGDRAELVPTERGSWPSFYAALERALREGGPPPVDPADAIAVLDVLDAARKRSGKPDAHSDIRLRY